MAIKKVLILGGDGFCGWPTALHLANAGYQVTIVDDLSRREIDGELGVKSLTPIQDINTRLRVAKEYKLDISFLDCDISNEPELLARSVKATDAIVHFAEQRAAPYSMKSRRHRTYTVNRNVSATENVLNALLENPDAQLVHLGTMGVYGYGGGSRVPEGWIDFKGTKALHPMRPGSVYHASKCLDQVLFEFYARNDGLAITDLHQGIVWGTQTRETNLDERLINRFDYDGDYGTVLNRFLMQAAIGYPLTVHGTGGQTRAFIHLQDTVKCVRKALENPAAKGEYRIFNQMAETQRVRDLANFVSKRTNAEIAYVDNPRNEAPENDLEVDNDGLISLGWNPILMREELMNEVKSIAERYAHRCDTNKIPCKTTWHAY